MVDFQDPSIQNIPGMIWYLRLHIELAEGNFSSPTNWDSVHLGWILVFQKARVLPCQTVRQVGLACEFDGWCGQYVSQKRREGREFVSETRTVFLLPEMKSFLG